MRIRVVLTGLLLVGASCSDPYEGGLEGAPGAWLAFSADVNEADELSGAGVGAALFRNAVAVVVEGWLYSPVSLRSPLTTL